MILQMAVKGTSNSLDRALALLEMIEQTPGGMSSGDIRRRLHIPKSSYGYLMTRLVDKGYVMRDEETHHYKIGLTPLVLAHGTLREMGFRSATEPTLYRLVSETGLAASIGVLERHRVLLVDRVESPEFAKDAADFANRAGRPLFGRNLRQRRERDIGRELPAHSNSLGKILLAHLSRRQVLELIAKEGLPRITPKTIVSKAKLLAELEQVRRQGFAESDEEQYLGVRGVGAAIYDASGAACAAVSVTGNPAEPVWKESMRLIELVRAAGWAISKSMRL
jgi:IclR family transcriptional regulator, KDG regulon repressor